MDTLRVALRGLVSTGGGRKPVPPDSVGDLGENMNMDCGRGLSFAMEGDDPGGVLDFGRERNSFDSMLPAVFVLSAMEGVPDLKLAISARGSGIMDVGESKLDAVAGVGEDKSTTTSDVLRSFRPKRGSGSTRSREIGIRDPPS